MSMESLKDKELNLDQLSKEKSRSALSESELEKISGGFPVWDDKYSIQFKYTVGDEVEVYDEPYVLRWTTERVRINCCVKMEYAGIFQNYWGPAYEGYEVDGGKFREFCEWEIEGSDY